MSLSEQRIDTVRRHMALECVSDWDAVIATFEHPRYEMYGSGQVFDGEDAVRGYFRAAGSDRIVCERPYYDQGAVLRALDLS